VISFVGSEILAVAFRSSIESPTQIDAFDKARLSKGRIVCIAHALQLAICCHFVVCGRRCLIVMLEATTAREREEYVLPNN